MTDMAIRTLTKTDYAVVQFIRERLANEWKITTDEVDRNFINPSFGKGFPFIYIASTSDGTFAGKIILTIEQRWFLGIDNAACISGLFVPKEFRGRRIARKLIAICESVCRKLGYKKLYLDTRNSVSYYQKLGSWEILGTDAWKVDSVTIMAKKIYI